MSLPPFVLLRPRGLEEALGHLSQHGPEAMIVAGGTDVVPNLRAGLFAPRALLDIKGLTDLKGISFDAENGLRIGALTTLTEVAESPVVRKHYLVLAEAAGTVASPVLRNMGTLGGNLCLETRCLWYNQSYTGAARAGLLEERRTVCHVAPGGSAAGRCGRRTPRRRC
jgi:4-hydroxybenzoyl-CoA reductase subunit beta